MCGCVWIEKCVGLLVGEWRVESGCVWWGGWISETVVWICTHIVCVCVCGCVDVWIEKCVGCRVSEWGGCV